MQPWLHVSIWLIQYVGATGDAVQCECSLMYNDDCPCMLFVSTVYHFFALSYYMLPILSWLLSEGNANSCAVVVIINKADVIY
jgi:hypothetical protein